MKPQGIDKKILIVKNITREGPGLFGAVLEAEGIPFEIVDLGSGESFPPPEQYAAVVVLGGPDSANDQTPKMIEEIGRVRECLEQGIPYLGVCLGLQVGVKAAGGRVKKSPVREIGFFGPDRKPFKIHLTDAGRRDPLTASFGTQEPLEVFHLHAETVELTNEMKLLGRGEFCENQIVRIGERAYGLQGHFELTREMLEVWAAEDPDLQTLRISDLKEGFAAVGTAFREAARRLLSNFLAISPTSRKLRSGTPGNVL